MRTATCWLALALTGVCGSVASAQSPLMYGVPPAPGYGPGYPYGQPIPYYGQPQGCASQPFYQPAYGQPAYGPPAYQPQPRVLYVPATPPSWESAPVPSQPVSQRTMVPVQHAVPGAAPATAPGSEANPVIIYEGGAAKAGAKATKTLPARTASLLRPATSPGAVTELPASSGSDCGSAMSCNPSSCGPAACAPCAAPKAPHQPKPCCDDDTTNWLPKCHWNLQVLGGAYADFGGARYNWMQGSVRLGHVCCGEFLSCLPGGFEGIIEFAGAGTTDSDFGTQFFGGGLLLRYNLVQPGSRLVPYVQAGVGCQYNDAFRDHVQNFLGSPAQLTAQAQFGMRIFLTKCLSLDMEAGVQRIASMNMNDRDDGITGVGGAVGLSYFFPHSGHK